MWVVIYSACGAAELSLACTSGIRFQCTASMKELKNKMPEGKGLFAMETNWPENICHSWSQTLLSSCLTVFRFLQISRVMSKGREWHLSPHSLVTSKRASPSHLQRGHLNIWPGSHSTFQSEPWCRWGAEASGKHCSSHTQVTWDSWALAGPLSFNCPTETLEWKSLQGSTDQPNYFLHYKTDRLN